jgi:hypothetical protein
MEGTRGDTGFIILVEGLSALLSIGTMADSPTDSRDNGTLCDPMLALIQFQLFNALDCRLNSGGAHALLLRHLHLFESQYWRMLVHWHIRQGKGLVPI